MPLPLCARCSGTFLGIIFGMLLLRLVGEGRASRMPPVFIVVILGALIGFWALDSVHSVVSWLSGQGLYRPSNALRLASGMANGLALGTLLYPIYHGVMWRRTDPRRVLQRVWPLGILLGAGATCCALMLAWSDAPYGLWVALTFGATMASLSLLNAMLIVLLLGKEGSAERWTQWGPFYGLGMVAALSETTALALVRRLIGA
ncbi:MAG: DUF2085 domain-containing protein [Chloroflexi bacterium]|nr:DUF2085 domain-containing protein [Chloroflexota bacterium]